MLHKLLHYGIQGPAYTLIESYLSDRQQFVSVNKFESSPKPISIGVPQGSILDPLLFLIYTNGLPNASSCPPRLFADDTYLIVKNSALNELEIKCNSALRNLNRWCCPNELQINPVKYNAIIISPKLNTPQPELNLLYNTANISLNDSYKYLGVILDNKLNFQLYILTLEKRESRSIGILSKLRFLFPSSTLLVFYHALVHPHSHSGIAHLKPALTNCRSSKIKPFASLPTQTGVLPLRHSFETSMFLKLQTCTLMRLLSLCINIPKTCFSRVFQPFSVRFLKSSIDNTGQNQKTTFIFPSFPHASIKDL